ncbi:hypothetical protein T01_16296 [Trichinella spiralis]|uniref:Uncharacterized protein n=1 Tax=Trichinella spiralis TaxID=6334 RepID=A0A0V1BWS2_TRISP|nr:hypothetical protein T01_16296 [Trichinella spiralis]
MSVVVKLKEMHRSTSGDSADGSASEGVACGVDTSSEDSLANGTSNQEQGTSPAFVKLIGELQKLRVLLEFEPLYCWYKEAIGGGDSRWRVDGDDWLVRFVRHLCFQANERNTQAWSNGRYEPDKSHYKIAFLEGEKIACNEKQQLINEENEYGSIGENPIIDQCSNENGNGDGSSCCIVVDQWQSEFPWFNCFLECLMVQSRLLAERKEALQRLDLMLNLLADDANLKSTMASVSKAAQLQSANAQTTAQDATYYETELVEQVMMLRSELQALKCELRLRGNENGDLKCEMISHNRKASTNEYRDKCVEANLNDNSEINNRLEAIQAAEIALLDQMIHLIDNNSRLQWNEEDEDLDPIKSSTRRKTYRILEKLSERTLGNQCRLQKQIDELEAELSAKEQLHAQQENSAKEKLEEYSAQVIALEGMLNKSKVFMQDQALEHEEEHRKNVERIENLERKLKEAMIKSGLSESSLSVDGVDLMNEMQDNKNISCTTVEKSNEMLEKKFEECEQLQNEMHELKEQYNALRSEKWKLGQENDVENDEYWNLCFALRTEKALMTKQLYDAKQENASLQIKCDKLSFAGDNTVVNRLRDAEQQLELFRLKEKENEMQIDTLKEELKSCRAELYNKAMQLNYYNEQCDLDDAGCNEPVLRYKLKKKKEEIERLQSTLSQMEVHVSAVKDVQKAYESQKSKTEDYRSKMKEKEEENINLRDKISDLEHVLDQTLKEKENQSAKIIQLEQNYTRANEQLQLLAVEFQQWKENAKAQYDDTCCKFNDELNQLRDRLRMRLGIEELCTTVDCENMTSLWDALTGTVRNVLCSAYVASTDLNDFEAVLKQCNFDNKIIKTPLLSVNESEKSTLQKTLPVVDLSNNFDPAARDETVVVKKTSGEFDANDATSPAKSSVLADDLLSQDLRVMQLKSEMQQLRDYNNRLMNNLQAANENRMREMSRHKEEMKEMRERNLHLNKLIGDERATCVELRIKTDKLFQELLDCRMKYSDVVERYKQLNRDAESSSRMHQLLHAESVRVIKVLRESFDEEVILNRRLQKERDMLLTEANKLREEKVELKADSQLLLEHLQKSPRNNPISPEPLGLHYNLSSAFNLFVPTCLHCHDCQRDSSKRELDRLIWQNWDVQRKLYPSEQQQQQHLEKSLCHLCALKTRKIRRNGVNYLKCAAMAVLFTLHLQQMLLPKGRKKLSLLNEK